MDVARLRRRGQTQVIEKFYLDDLRTAGVNVLVCSLFVASEFIPEMALRMALTQIGNLHAEMRESPGLFALCRTTAEARRTVEKGGVALFLSFEGVDPLGCDLQLLSVFHELGVRLIGLTWSRRNFAADGCHFHPVEEGRTGGLTAFGVALLKEAERLGMIVDVSHLNDVGFDEVFRFFRGPIISSHANSRSLCPVVRNLTDDQLKQIAACGGVVGLNNMAHFVRQGEGAFPPDEPRWTGLLEHARHIVDLVGEDHLGLGLDLCEFDKPEEQRDRSIFPTYRHVRPFIEALRGAFPARASEKILGENWMRVLDLLS